MLESLKRLFAPKAAAAALDLRPVEDWARRRSLAFKRARDDDGFVLEGAIEGKPWRLEWGPSRRDYIDGRELRLRMEIGLPSDAQMLVLSRPLMDTLEHRTFEDFTDTLQTTVGDKSPEEMRWLVMFAKVDLGASAALRQHFGAVASTPAVGTAWLQGGLGRLLEEAAGTPTGLLRGEPPFVLMTHRGRVYLRMQLAEAEPRDLNAALALFETAATQALRAVASAGPARPRRPAKMNRTATSGGPVPGAAAPAAKTAAPPLEPKRR